MNGTVEALRVVVGPHGLAELDTENDVCVVVDVLRASTTIAYALAAGARGVIPVETVEEATRLAATLDHETTLLCGERNSVRIEGFALGNSPREYTAEAVADKTLVFSSTNGARALAAVAGARECLTAAFPTLGAAAGRAAAASRVTIVCAGAEGGFSLEDFFCAGMLVRAIESRTEGGILLDDAARTAREIGGIYEDRLAEIVETCDHGRELVALGFAEDLALTCAVDRFPFVPILRDGCLVPAEVAAHPSAR